MNTIMIGMLVALLFVPLTAYASIGPANATNTIDQSAITTEISFLGLKWIG
jgi:hypothetical protein